MGKETLSVGEINALIRELETKMARLRTIYEQYFQGIEKIPPSVLRKDVVRLVRRIDNLYIRNTATKFRVRSLVQKFNTYKAYWMRVERQIEQGTYVRDIQKARRNKLRREAAEAAEGVESDDGSGHQSTDSEFTPGNVIDLDFGEDLSSLEMELNAMAQQQTAQTQQPTHQDQQPVAQSAPDPMAEKQRELGIRDSTSIREAKLQKLKSRLNKKQSSESNELPVQGASVDQVQKLAAAKQKIQAHQNRERSKTAEETKARAVYEKLVAAKQQCNESTAGLTYESVKSSLAKQKEHLKSTRGANEVDFQVVIKNGKAFLKPKIK